MRANGMTIFRGVATSEHPNRLPTSCFKPKQEGDMPAITRLSLSVGAAVMSIVGLSMRLGSLFCATLILALGYAYAQQPAPQTPAPNPYLMGTEGLNQGPRGLTSYMPVAITESFAQIFARMTAAKPGIEQAHTAVLKERYDLTDRPAQGV